MLHQLCSVACAANLRKQPAKSVPAEVWHLTPVPCPRRSLPCSAQDNPSLTAFVDGPRIVQTCGCGGSWATVGTSPAVGMSSAAIVSR